MEISFCNLFTQNIYFRCVTHRHGSVRQILKYIGSHLDYPSSCYGNDLCTPGRMESKHKFSHVGKIILKIRWISFCKACQVYVYCELTLWSMNKMANALQITFFKCSFCDFLHTNFSSIQTLTSYDFIKTLKNKTFCLSDLNMINLHQFWHHEDWHFSGIKHVRLISLNSPNSLN